MDRRCFLKTVGVAGACAVGHTVSRGQEPADDPAQFAMLVDTTRCAGCRNCEVVCAEAHGLAEPDLDDDAVFDREREPTDDQWSVVNRYETEAGEIFVKRQCMHCVLPACASACLTRAMVKTDEGPVVWREDKCMGCRFCMVSCPFDVPTFEYDSAVPKIQKCTMCWERTSEGKLPVCAENCPGEALFFGRRDEVIAEARRRIHEDPEGYVDHIYGEHEAGGTGYLYLAAAPFKELGFRTDLGTEPYPRLTEDFLYGVPVVLALWPAFLLALSQATKKNEEISIEGEDDEPVHAIQVA